MSEGMKRIVEALNAFEGASPEKAEVLECMMQMLAVIVEVHNGRSIRCYMETSKHAFELTFIRSDLDA